MEEWKKHLAKYSDYFDDLRQFLYKIAVIFISTFAIGFFLATPMLKFLLSLLRLDTVVVAATSPFQIVDLAMNIGVFFAIMVIIPVFVYYLYAFLKPGLLPHERKIFFSFLPAALLLFVIGFLYGFTTMYWALRMIAEVNVNLGVVNLWDISRFVSQMVLTSALLGLIFEFPIVVSFLIKLNILKVEFLKAKRRHAVVIIFIFVSLLPPTDGLSLLIMALPLLLIYELTILFNSRFKSLTVYNELM
jgi:sec-independent protein translocase protein TatC